MTADEVEALIHLVYGDGAVRQLLTEKQRKELFRDDLHTERVKAWAVGPEKYARKLAEHIVAILNRREGT